jgi:excisionase family DNA binding protein
MSTAMPRAGRPALYTAEQTAWILGVSTNRIYRAIRTGTLPTIQHHSRYRIPATALAHLLAETIREANTSQPPNRANRSGGAQQ